MRQASIASLAAVVVLGCGGTAPHTTPPLAPDAPLPRILTAEALVGDEATQCTATFTGATPAVSCGGDALDCRMLIEAALDPGPPPEVVYGCGSRCPDENIHEVVVVQTAAGLLLAVGDTGADSSCGARATVERGSVVLVGGGEDGTYEVAFPWDTATHRFGARVDNFTPSTH